MKKTRLFYTILLVVSLTNGTLRNVLSYAHIIPKSPYSFSSDTKTYFKENEKHRVINEYSRKYVGKNLITILGETFDNKLMIPELMPNLARLENNSYEFDNFFIDEMQSAATVNSEFQTLTSLFPSGSNVISSAISNKYLNNTFTYSLPKVLNSNYDTYYFHSGYGSFYNRNSFMTLEHMGFEKVYFGDDLVQQGIEGIDEPQFSDIYLNEFFEQFVDPTNLFYAHVLSYSVHGPFSEDAYYSINEFPKIIEKIKGRLGLGDIDLFNYVQEGIDQHFGKSVNVSYEIKNYMIKLIGLDIFIGDLFNWLESKNILNKTIITLQRDHSPYMMDHHSVINQNHYNTYLKDVLGIDLNLNPVERLRQSYYIYDYNLEKNSEHIVINNAGTLIDIVPTLVNLFKGNLVSYNYYFGNDLFSTDSLAYISAKSSDFSKKNSFVTNGLKENMAIIKFVELGKKPVGKYEEGELAKYQKYLAQKNHEFKLSETILKDNYFAPK
jgi:hypothetical protein